MKNIVCNKLYYESRWGSQDEVEEYFINLIKGDFKIMIYSAECGFDFLYITNYSKKQGNLITTSEEYKYYTEKNIFISDEECGVYQDIIAGFLFDQPIKYDITDIESGYCKSIEYGFQELQNI